jgi:hypothetical protein
VKPNEWSEAIRKNEIGPGRSSAIWDDLVRKAQKRARDTGGAGQRFREELETAKMLQEDYASGGAIIDYLMREDRRRASGTAIAKRALERTVPGNATPAEDIADERAAVIMKRDHVSYARAITQVYTSDPDLYSAYEIQKAGMSGEEVLKRISRMKLRDRDDASADDTDECDPDQDEECDDDEMKRRKRRVAARRKHDYGPDDQALFEKRVAEPGVRAECPNCENMVSVDVVRKRRACPVCSKELTVV